ncbi:MAG TPA: hypothetical protein VGB07_36300 [Blastocatellia bacterium]
MIRCRKSYLVSRVWLNVAPVEIRFLVETIGNPANRGFISVPMNIGQLIERECYEIE